MLIASFEGTSWCPVTRPMASSEPPSGVRARRSAQRNGHSIVKRCNAALASLGGSLRARREAAICGVTCP